MRRHYETLKEARKAEKEGKEEGKIQQSAYIHDNRKLHPNRKRPFYLGTYMEWLNWG